MALSINISRLVFLLVHNHFQTVRIAVFAEGAAANEARKVGADIVVGDGLTEEIKVVVT